MLHQGKIWVGTGDDGRPVCLLPQMANRHGLIAGATGTGKTVTLKVLAEGFSDLGVPVFLGDIKGDLSGMVKTGQSSEKITSRLEKCGVAEGFEHHAYPTVFWDVYGDQGIPVRATVKGMGSLLFSRMLGLNDVQTGVINIMFHVAEDLNHSLVTLDDVRELLQYIGQFAKDDIDPSADNASFALHYGNVAIASIGAIQRALLQLEDQGGKDFFGEPALDLGDWMCVDENGRGYINILSCDRLFQNPLMYTTVLMWMLSGLYDRLPEVGDLDKPKMVFFFDEAHLLFNDCTKQLLNKVEQIVRLIRSKGVGVYFITQNPSDVPSTVLSQLNNRVQHALRAYTPLDQRGVQVAAQTFRANPRFSTEAAISNLKTGEALASFLDADGTPTIVSRATILPPQSNMNAITPEERAQSIRMTPLAAQYGSSFVEPEPEPQPVPEIPTDIEISYPEDALPADEAVPQPLDPADEDLRKQKEAAARFAAQFMQQQKQPLSTPVSSPFAAQPQAPQATPTMQPVQPQQPVPAYQPVQPQPAPVYQPAAQTQPQQAAAQPAPAAAADEDDSVTFREVLGTFGKLAGTFFEQRVKPKSKQLFGKLEDKMESLQSKLDSSDQDNQNK